jgi:hypothetical protein
MIILCMCRCNNFQSILWVNGIEDELFYDYVYLSVRFYESIACRFDAADVDLP